MKTLQLLSLLLLSVTFTSCFTDGGVVCTKPNGEVIEEEVSLESFSRIDLSMAGEVYITQGDASSVRIEASDNVIDLIVTNVSGDELNLRTKRGKCIRGKSDVKFYVTTPDVEGITLSGSGKIFNETPLTGKELDIKLSGSGEIDLENLEYDNAYSSISGSGKVWVDGFDTDDFEVKTSGSGRTTISNLEANNVSMSISGSGSTSFESSTTDRLDASIAGSGKLFAFDMPAERVELSVGGSGDCEVTANEELDVRITGSGSVYYKGQPSIDQKITGSGRIKNSN